MKWQPIETAPKDGTRILCVMHGVVEIVQFDKQEYHKHPNPYWTTWNAYSKNRDRGSQPLVWMPLPEPPQAAEGKDGEG